MDTHGNLGNIVVTLGVMIVFRVIETLVQTVDRVVWQSLPPIGKK
jgi:hypothetical protein